MQIGKYLLTFKTHSKHRPVIASLHGVHILKYFIFHKIFFFEYVSRGFVSPYRTNVENRVSS